MAYEVLTVTLNAAVDTTYGLNRLQPGAIHTVQTIHRAAGGKGNNVARVLALLGIPVAATGFAGGHAGAFIQADLERLGILADFEPVPGESRTCLAMLTPDSVTEMREPGPTIPPEGAETFCHRFARLVATARAVVLSGSLPPGLPAAYYSTLISIARQAGCYIALDTSGPALAAAVPAGPDLVKPNRDELAAWAGQPLTELRDLIAAAERLRKAGAYRVALSLGPGGLLYTGPEGRWLAEPPAVAVVNPVGSGDSLIAGLVAGRLRNRPLPAALRLAVACGTANALTGTVATPDLAEVERLEPLIRLSQP